MKTPGSAFDPPTSFPTFTAQMRVHTSLETIKQVRRPVLTTGTFDGVHRGHRTMLQRLTAIAKEEGGESVLFTFHPHPRMVLFPGDNDLKLLCTHEEKIALLEAAGLEHLLVIPFSRDFSRMRATDYVREFLVGEIGVRCLVVGYDHRFGRNREGDLLLLRQLGDMNDFRVEEIPAQEVDHVRVSSTKVRNALLEGKVVVANELLGYEYPLSGVVIKGDQLGRTLGYPTANIGAVDQHKLVPLDGIYTAGVEVGGESHVGMLYIGDRPTIRTTEVQKSIEVYIFDLDRDVYGESITVSLKDRIRGDMQFNDLDELKARMDQDRTIAMKLLQRNT
ncbi:MAG: riboflavin biosynthesis protein RibF [Flavobacteriales bacterium]|nr:riboflavin biosynthesis protein RibF [Flavobacteriales bacterium]